MKNTTPLIILIETVMNEEMTLANEKLDEPPVCTLAL